MRVVRSRAVATVCGAVLFALISATEASACSCVFGGVAACQEFWQVDAVFIGTATQGGAATADEGSYKRQIRALKFSVAEVFRGERVAEIEVATGSGGGDCGYGFRVGETYLVYASRNKRDGRLYTGICQRTRPLAEAAEDLAYIRALPQAEAGGVVFGTVGRRNHAPGDGEDWFKPLAAAALVVEGQGARVEARTDAAGRFRVAGLAPGSYKVSVRPPKGLTYWKATEGGASESEVKVAARGCAETWFIFEPDTRIAGRLLDAAGQPVAGVRVQMRGTPGGESAHAHLSEETDGEGRFEFTLLEPGGYVLGVRLFNSPDPNPAPHPRTYYPGVASEDEAAVVRVKEGEQVSDLELRLPPRLAGRRAAGLVAWDDGRPAAGAQVFVSVLEGGAATAFTNVVADERGRFSFTAYEGLGYKLKPHANAPAGGAEVWGAEVDLPPAGTPPLRLVLPSSKK